jgi:esterase/lipase superfamily enzyme
MHDRPVVRWILALILAAYVGGCTRPPELVGVMNTEIAPEEVPQITRQKIFITTTRQASNQLGAFYSAGRARDLGLASVDVTIPPTHVVGQLERPKSLPPDPRTEFTVVSPLIYRSDASFISEINRELARRPAGQRTVLLFVHGYNNTTSDAILGLAQFVEDSGYQGVPVLFTWASAAKTPRYVYDLNSALVARAKLKEISDILTRTRAERFDIFAHSMGTFLTMEGLVDAAQAGTLGTRAKIDHIVLASPDIDIDLFRTQIAFIPQRIRDRMYLLVSRDDRALRASRRIAGGVPRLGAADVAELEEFGLTVIDLSDITDSSSGSHSKFTGSPEVVQLIGAGLNRAGRFDQAGSSGLEQFRTGVGIRIFGG